MRLPIRICLSLLFVVFCSATLAAPYDWPMPRRDTALTGRAEAKGAIRHPAITGKLFAGAYEGLAVITPANGYGGFSIPPNSEMEPDYLAKHSAEWTTGAAQSLDAADPRLGFADSSSARYAKLLSDVPALQKVQFEDAFAATATQKGNLYAFDTPDGQPRLVWQTEPDKDVWSPILLVLDADNDGQPEIVVSTHYRVMIYNGQTGALKYKLKWHHMRNYGFFGSFTVPNDPYPKFVVIADFISHIDVLGNDGKKLKILWRKDIEATIIRKQKVTRPGPNPVADLDGDGRPEITLNIYNDTGDKRWHCISFDALTGEVRFDFPAVYLHGLADTDGDGLPELFAEETRGMAVPQYGPIRILSLKGGKQNVLWSHRRGKWQTTVLSHLPLTENTIAADGHRTILLNRSGAAVECYAVTDSRSSGNETRPTLMVIRRSPSGKWQTAARVTGPNGAQLDVKRSCARDGITELLVSWRSDGTGDQSFTTDHAKGSVVSWGMAPGRTPAPVVARLRDGEAPTVLFQNGNEQITALQKVNGEWATRWRQQGRAMTVSAPQDLGILAADVNGDGHLETLFARRSRTGEAELVAVRPDGRPLWSHTFRGFDGAPPVWNLGGLTIWTVGRFAHKDHLDVFATLRRSSMHSDEGFCLCGKTGREIWRQDKVVLPDDTDWESTRGYAGTEIAAADIDGDGLDELVCVYPDRYWTASGKTGAIDKVVNTANKVFPNMWVAYGIPVVADFAGAGKPQVLWGGCRYVTA
ncbi:MAG: hypothetical protein Q7T82_04375, partial [Armatimonadota bacterium]|nr:hypothetical protein [Armatimonadota bacterium]